MASTAPSSSLKISNAPFSLHRTSFKATSVNQAVKCRFIPNSNENIVTCGANVLTVYSIHQSSDDGECRLQHLHTWTLHASIESMERVKIRYDNTKAVGQEEKEGDCGDGDSLILAFLDAKICIVRFNKDIHDIETVAMFCYEDDDMKAGMTHNQYPPMIRVDPLSRCSAVILYGRSILIIPFNDSQANSSSFLFESTTLQTSEKEKNNIFGSGNTNSNFNVPSVGACIGEPFLLDLDRVIQDQMIDAFIDIQFLHGFNSPTLALLYEPVKTHPGRLFNRKDTGRVDVVTLDIVEHISASIFCQSNLPFDCVSIIPVPVSGGLIVLAVNSLFYITQGCQPVGRSLNALGDATSLDYAQSCNDRFKMTLDCVRHTSFISQDSVILSLKDGRIFLLKLHSQTGYITFQKLASSVICTSVLYFEQHGFDFLFLGSRVGNSVLIKVSVKTEAELALENSGEETLNIKDSTSAVLSNGDIDKVENSVNGDIMKEGKGFDDQVMNGEEVDIKQDETSETSLKFEKRRQYSGTGDIHDVSSGFTFKLCDTIMNIGPCGKVCMGEPALLAAEFAESRAADSDVELVSTSGYGKHGALTVLQQNIKPQVLTTFKLRNVCRIYTMPDAKSIDSTSSTLVLTRSNSSSMPIQTSNSARLGLPSHSTMVLHASNEINEVENSAFFTTGKTLIAGKMMNHFIIQVYESGLKLIYTHDTVIQEMSVDQIDPKSASIVDACISDPYLIILTSRDNCVVYKLQWNDQLSTDHTSATLLKVGRTSLKDKTFKISCMSVYADHSGIFSCHASRKRSSASISPASNSSLFSFEKKKPLFGASNDKTYQSRLLSDSVVPESQKLAKGKSDIACLFGLPTTDISSESSATVKSTDKIGERDDAMDEDDAFLYGDGPDPITLSQDKPKPNTNDGMFKRSEKVKNSPFDRIDAILNRTSDVLNHTKAVDTPKFDNVSTKIKKEDLKLTKSFEKAKRTSVEGGGAAGDVAVVTHWLILYWEGGSFEIHSIPDLRVRFIALNLRMGADLLTDASLVASTHPRNSSSFAFPVETLDPSTIPKVTEVRVFELGSKYKKRPYLFVRTSDHELLMYEAYPFTSSDSSSPSARTQPPNSSTKIPNLKVRFKKVRHGLLLRQRKSASASTQNQHDDIDSMNESSVQSNAESAGKSDIEQQQWHSMIHFESVNSVSGVFLCGPYPHWVMVCPKSGLFCYHAMSVDGPIHCMTPFNNVNCLDGFIYFNTKDEIRICTLPPHMSYTSCAEFAVRKIHLQATPHFVAFHLQSKTYALITSVQVNTDKCWQFTGEDKAYESSESYLANDSKDKFPLPTKSVYYIQLFSPTTWTSIPSTEVELEADERVTDCKHLYLACEGAHTGLKGYVVCSISVVYSEDIIPKGIIRIYDIIEVIPQPGQPLTKHKIKQVHGKEQKGGPITAIAAVNGNLVAAVGQKIYIFQFKNGDLFGIAFIDSLLYTQHLCTIKNFILAADIMKSVFLLQYQQDYRTLSIIAKDPFPSQVYTCDFLVDNSKLSFISSDVDRNIQVLCYEAHNMKCSMPASNSQMMSYNGNIGGLATLVRRADFQLGQHINTMFRMRCKIKDSTTNRILTGFEKCQVTWYATLDGSLGYIIPVSEKFGRRLNLWISSLCQIIQPVAGLNAKSARTMRTRYCSLSNTNIARGILDGDLLFSFTNLSYNEKHVLAKKLGARPQDIMDELAMIDRIASHF